jgi:hypothetical protein
MRLIVICAMMLALAIAAEGQTVVKNVEGGQTIVTKSGTGQTVFKKTEGGRTMIRIEGGAFIPELACALGDVDHKVKVLNAMPAANRPKAYASVDVQTNDLILMVNAKPLKTAEAFRTLYEVLAPGDTIALGIKRGEEMHITSFVKMDPKDMPKDRRIIIKKKD